MHPRPSYSSTNLGANIDCAPALVFSKNQWPQPHSMHYSSILHPPATPPPFPLCPASPFSERNVSLPLLPLFQNSIPAFSISFSFYLLSLSLSLSVGTLGAGLQIISLIWQAALPVYVASIKLISQLC